MADLPTKQFAAIVGSENVLTAALEREYYAQDVFSAGLPAGVVVRPSDTEQLARVVKAATEHGLAVVPRGGGMSYTGGYIPQEEDSVLLDLSRMQRVLEINATDRYVTVEAGISWQALHQALRGSGLRTPYWGTLSGLHASVGGSVSQNSIFWGSGQFGTAADSVLAMAVVTADGSIIRTGSAAQRNAPPFFRHFGPDLSGLFTGDCGALGIKATLTLRLLPEYPARAFGSFAFDRYQDMLPAMAEISRQNLSMECFGFDPYLQRQRLKRESLARDVQQFTGMLKSARGVGAAIKDGLTVALSGRRYMDAVRWSFHSMIEEHTDSSAQHCLQKIRAIVKQHKGRELPDSIPKLVRANPFGPLNNMLGPHGERWVPVHGLVAHSRAVPVMDEIEAIFAQHRQQLDELDIGVGYLLATVSTHCSVLEPVFFWPDALQEIHRRTVEPAHLKRLKGFAENLPARELVTSIRQKLAEMFRQQGAVHLQIGKAYQYRQGLQTESYALVQALKRTLDPNNRMNPGALGLNSESSN